MGFVKTVVYVSFLAVVTALAVWWSGFLEAIGMGELTPLIDTLLRITPGWLWAVLLLLVVGGVAIELLFD